MSETPILSYLSNIDWHAIWQWYSTHINAGHLIRAWQHDNVFSKNDWLTIILLAVHLLLLLSLAYPLIQRYREARFRIRIESRRSRLTHRSAKEAQPGLEAKVADSACLKQAYHLHRYAMYEQALSKYKQAFQASPYDINTYLVGIKIISEMDTPYSPFIRFLQESISNLREKHPSIWKEVARYGSEKTPDLYQWQFAA